MCVFKRLKKHKAIENFDHFLFNFMPAVFCFKYLVQSLVAVPFVRQPIHNTISKFYCQLNFYTFLNFFYLFFHKIKGFFGFLEKTAKKTTRFDNKTGRFRVQLLF